MKTIIGIKGLIGSGKSTIAKILMNNYYMNEYAIASPLKEFALLIGFEYHQVYGTQEEKLEINKEWGISGRHFMQKFGTDLVRENIANVLPEMDLQGKTLWIRAFEINVLNKINNIVVSDVRFKDESDVIKNHNGWIIEVIDEKIRNGTENKEKSEISTKEIIPHILIHNTGTLDELENMIDILMDIIKKNKPWDTSDGNIMHIYPYRSKKSLCTYISRILRIFKFE